MVDQVPKPQLPKNTASQSQYVKKVYINLPIWSYYVAGLFLVIILIIGSTQNLWILILTYYLVLAFLIILPTYLLMRGLIKVVFCMIRQDIKMLHRGLIYIISGLIIAVISFWIISRWGGMFNGL